MGLSWIIKLTGMGCIMAASVLTGLGLELRLKKRYMILSELQETIQYLRKTMTYRRSPVDESLREASVHCHTELRAILDSAAEAVLQRNGQSFCVLWEQSVEQYLPHGILIEEEQQMLLKVAGALCGSDTSLQNTLLEQYADRFLQQSSLAGTQYREKSRLYRRLSQAAGIFLILLLL